MLAILCVRMSISRSATAAVPNQKWLVHLIAVLVFSEMSTLTLWPDKKQ